MIVIYYLCFFRFVLSRFSIHLNIIFKGLLGLAWVLFSKLSRLFIFQSKYFLFIFKIKAVEKIPKYDPCLAGVGTAKALFFTFCRVQDEI